MRKRVSRQDMKVVLLKQRTLHCPDTAAKGTFADIFFFLFTLFHLSCVSTASNRVAPRRTSARKAPRLTPGVVTLGAERCPRAETSNPLTPLYTLYVFVQVSCRHALVCQHDVSQQHRYRADGPLINVGEFVFPSLRKPCEPFYSRRVCFLFSPITHRDISILRRACTPSLSHKKTHTLARLVWKPRTRCRGAGDCGNEGVS